MDLKGITHAVKDYGDSEPEIVRVKLYYENLIARLESQLTIERKKGANRMFINIIFDGPPSHEAGRFVEVETDDGRSIKVGEWVERLHGYWALRIKVSK